MNAPSGSPPESDYGAARSGWLGFAGTLFILIGAFNAIEGLVAIFKDEVFVVGEESLVVTDFTAWGWFFLILGVIQVLVGFGILDGARMGARRRGRPGDAERDDSHRLPRRVSDLGAHHHQPLRRRDLRAARQGRGRRDLSIPPDHRIARNGRCAVSFIYSLVKASPGTRCSSFAAGTPTRR